ncbi:hypothetical protein ACIRPH_30045 [Nocardiopsis sp. NPDC101807]|uniref:hypothetical protein n=1 Tax=Nocardiopsis sp. NPDC101807 TaxID=3364339 RepID=UPI0037F6BF40
MSATGGTCQTPGCDDLVADAWVCSGCARRLTLSLAHLPELLAELDVTLTRQARTGRPGESGRAAETPLPFDRRASIIADAIRSTLAAWVRVLHGDVLADVPEADRPDRAAAYLTERIEVIRHREDGGQLVDEVLAVITEAEHVIDLPADSMLAGHCPHCGRAVYTRPGAAIGRCRFEDCDGEVDVSDWRRAAIASIDDMTLPAADIARVLTVLGQPITANQVYLAASRGRLRPVDEQAARPRYRVADVRNLFTTTRHGRRTA